MNRSFRAPGEPPPEEPPLIPVFTGMNDPPVRRVPKNARRPGLVIGKPYPAQHLE